MMKRLLWVLLITSSAQAMVFDNRYLPLLLKPFERRGDTSSHIRLQPFFMHADRAFSDGFDVELPDITFPFDRGTYDQAVLERALITTCDQESFFRSDYASRTSIPWRRTGRIDAQGLAFLYEQALTPWLSVGINGLFGHVASRHEFFLQEQNVLEGTREYLSDVKEQMHEALGVCPPLYSETGFGDLDLYMRFWQRWDYCYKFRRIEAALRVGAIAPTAKEKDSNNPAAIALGGNKHWGAYAQLEGLFELKEDISLGFWLRASKRFKKTQCMRLPLCQENRPLTEPPEYGTIIADVEYDPGWTFVFNPQLVLSHLRRGFGIKAYYTLVSHLKDKACDLRVDPEFVADFSFVEHASSWGSEYATIGAFYDFGCVREHWYPKISLFWDIPVDWLVAKRSARTHSVSLMFEVDF